MHGRSGRTEDFALIQQPLDFIGINYYTAASPQANDSYPLKAGAVQAATGHLHRNRLGSIPAGP